MAISWDCRPSSLAFSFFTGKVVGEENQKLIGAFVYIEELGIGDDTDVTGSFLITNVPVGTYDVVVSYVGYKPVTKEIGFQPGVIEEDTFRLKRDERVLLDVEVFGRRRERPEKMDALTRIPLRLDEQVQSISMIPQKMLTDQGALTLHEAVRSAAIAQGLGNDLGSAGGVVNIATKTPRFINSGNVGFRTGSWGAVRPTFDVQFLTDRLQRSAFRLNGAWERADNYRVHISKDRIYLNPLRRIPQEPVAGSRSLLYGRKAFCRIYLSTAAGASGTTQYKTIYG